MHHPGPPRFVSVGDEVNIAPWNPDPDAEFSWSIVDAPANSEATTGDSSVIDFVPDIPGQYRLRLDAPDATHHLTVRAFTDNRKPITIELPTDKRPLERADVNRILETLEPQADIRDYVQFASPGRPRVHLEAYIEGRTQHTSEGTNDEAQSSRKLLVVDARTHAAPDSEYAAADLEVEFYVDDRDELHGCLDIDGHEARLAVTDIEDTVRIHAVAVAERHSVADVIRFDRDGTGVSITRPNDPPAWLEDAVVYEIAPRRFAGDAGDHEYITTFRDMEKRVPYVESLGVDCVWLMPVLETRTGSGYQIADYFEVASDLGTREEYESLVARYHDAGIRVMFDLVVNHSGVDNPLFQMSAAEVKEYRDWYVWEDPDDPSADYEYYFDWIHLPNFNYSSLAVRKYLLEVIEEWARIVDGFRCDVAFGTPHSFWKEARERIKAIDPDFVLLDEMIPRDAAYHETEFDVHHDKPLFHALHDVGASERPAADLLDVAESHREEGFPESALHFRYVENHDFERYLDAHDRDTLRAAAATVLTLPGVPMIYYGQERGINNSGWPQAPMQWENGDNDLTRFHRQLIAIRHAEPALTVGELERIEWNGPDTTVAFARTIDDRRIIVVLHFGPGEAEVTVHENLDVADLLTGKELGINQQDRTTLISVDTISLLPVR